MVYICSPLRGNIEENINKATSYCAYAAEQGVIPLAPHTMFTKFLDDTIPQQRQKGLSLGLELLKRCDELWVCGSIISQGMKSEIAAARQLNIPTRYLNESELAQKLRPPDIMKKEIEKIQQQYGPIFLARTEAGTVTSVILPEEAHENMKPEEIQKIEDYIVQASNKSCESDPVQEKSLDFELSQ
jgi:hypothetical protein